MPAARRWGSSSSGGRRCAGRSRRAPRRLWGRSWPPRRKGPRRAASRGPSHRPQGPLGERPSPTAATPPSWSCRSPKRPCRAPPRRRSGARSPPRRCARCAPAPRRRPMSQRRRSGRLWRCRRRRTPRCRRSRVLAWRNSLGPGTFSVGCSRRLRLNHFTSSPEGMSLSEVPGTRPRRATTPPGPSM